MKVASKANRSWATSEDSSQGCWSWLGLGRTEWICDHSRRPEGAPVGRGRAGLHAGGKPGQEGWWVWPRRPAKRGDLSDVLKDVDFAGWFFVFSSRFFHFYYSYRNAIVHICRHDFGLFLYFFSFVAAIAQLLQSVCRRSNLHSRQSWKF